MKEIEIAVQLLDNKESVMEKLSKFDFVGVFHTIDIYYYDEKRQNLKPNEDIRLHECFRIRNKEAKCYMTYKVDHFEDDIWIYSDEDEIEVSDFETVKKIISNLGLKQLVCVDFHTYKYLYGDFEIVIEDVKDLGLLLEVEKLNVSDDISYKEVKEIKAEVRNFINSFGIRYLELNDGKPEMLLKRKNIDNSNGQL